MNVEFSDPIDLRAIAGRFRTFAENERDRGDLAEASNSYAIASALEGRASRQEKRT